MPILHIEHRVGDFEAWKRSGFDADPIGRAKAGVRRHRITRPADDPNYVMVDLEFDTRAEAEAMRGALLKLWQNPLVEIEAPAARILEVVEVVELWVNRSHQPASGFPLTNVDASDSPRGSQ